MKSLSPNRPLLIMMVGIPGSGKSYFARQFSEVFNAPIISFDEIRSLLFYEPKYSKEEDVLVEQIMHSQASQLVKTQKTFIVDGGVNTRVARLNIERISRKNDYTTLVIWVQTDEASAKYRATRKNSSPTAFHNKPLSSELFDNYAKRINPPQFREENIVISGKHTFASQAKTVLKRLVSPRDNSLKQDIRQDSEKPRQRPPQPRRNFVVS